MIKLIASTLVLNDFSLYLSQANPIICSKAVIAVPANGIDFAISFPAVIPFSKIFAANPAAYSAFSYISVIYAFSDGLTIPVPRSL